MDCTIENNKLVPLSSAVKASIIDMWEDINKTQERYSHWACRELKMLYTQILPKIHGKATITVNQNTFTATLPLGFSEETFVGGINEKWHKVPFKLNNKLVDSKNITDIPCADACPKCNQDKSICNDLVVTEEKTLVEINSTTYEKIVVKKLYPNGDYLLETTTPVLDIDNDQVDYSVTKEFIANFDLKPCGCLDTTSANIATLQNCCPDIYCNYYAPCETKCNLSYGYKVFPESGLIQFDRNFPYSKIYLEYNGFIHKVRGQYYIPEVAFECIVEGIKRRATKDRKNVPMGRIQLQKQDYVEAKRNLQRILSRVSLSFINQAISQIPKFDIDFSNEWYGCFGNAAINSAMDGSSGGSAVGNSSNTTIINNTTYINRTAFILSVKADGTTGKPVPGQSTYQNNVLKGAVDVEYLFLAKQVLSRIDGDFTLDSATGIVDISPNQFFQNDSLIINYNKNI